MNSNYYARPVADTSTIEVVSSSPAWVETLYSLSGWQAYSGFDNGSKKSPIIIKDTTDIRFEYNATGKTKTVSLDKAYIDVADKTYTGKINLSPYSFIILMSLDPGNNRVKQNPPKQPGVTPVVY